MSATTPEPPYYAVIFTSVLSRTSDGYAETSARMLELAEQQPGFLGVDSAREQDTGITVSYWKDLPSIESWKLQAEHMDAQRSGRERWYQQFQVRIARVERAYDFP